LHLLNKEESPAKDTSRISLKMNLINAITALLIFIYFTITFLCDIFVFPLLIFNILFFTARYAAYFVDKIPNKHPATAVGIFVNLFTKDFKYAHYPILAICIILFIVMSIGTIPSFHSLIEIIWAANINLVFELIALCPYFPGWVYKFLVTRCFSERARPCAQPQRK
jgi:hypothetical protein